MAAQVNESLATNISSVNRAIGETKDSANMVLSASEQLAGEADNLAKAVAQFFANLRAGVDDAPPAANTARAG
jgi:methyl-accepting chemotaxis protein